MSFGKRTYLEYCASCHGEDGKGIGPAASALKTPQSDLTILAKMHTGNFPEHGSSDMPVGVLSSALVTNLTRWLYGSVLRTYAPTWQACRKKNHEKVRDVRFDTRLPIVLAVLIRRVAISTE